MGGKISDWKEELGRFLAPFMARLGTRRSDRFPHDPATHLVSGDLRALSGAICDRSTISSSYSHL
jgi:hypothetical protein